MGYRYFTRFYTGHKLSRRHHGSAVYTMSRLPSGEAAPKQKIWNRTGVELVAGTVAGISQVCRAQNHFIERSEEERCGVKQTYCFYLLLVFVVASLARIIIARLGTNLLHAYHFARLSLATRLRRSRCACKRRGPVE